MADKPAVIRGTFSDWRPVKSRKVLQLIVEVPLEQTEAVLATLGAPMPDTEKWVAVALLDANAAAEPARQERPRRKFEELPRSQQAGIRCEDPEFMQWLSRLVPDNWRASGGDPAECVRRLCRIQTRAALDREHVAAQEWDRLNTRFLQDTGRMAQDPRAA